MATPGNVYDPEEDAMPVTKIRLMNTELGGSQPVKRKLNYWYITLINDVDLNLFRPKGVRVYMSDNGGQRVINFQRYQPYPEHRTISAKDFSVQDDVRWTVADFVPFMRSFEGLKANEWYQAFPWETDKEPSCNYWAHTAIIELAHHMGGVFNQYVRPGLNVHSRAVIAWIEDEFPDLNERRMDPLRIYDSLAPRGIEAECAALNWLLRNQRQQYRRALLDLALLTIKQDRQDEIWQRHEELDRQCLWLQNCPISSSPEVQRQLAALEFQRDNLPGLEEFPTVDRECAELDAFVHYQQALLDGVEVWVRDHQYGEEIQNVLRVQQQLLEDMPNVPSRQYGPAPLYTTPTDALQGLRARYYCLRGLSPPFTYQDPHLSG